MFNVRNILSRAHNKSSGIAQQKKQYTEEVMIFLRTLNNFLCELSTFLNPVLTGKNRY